MNRLITWTLVLVSFGAFAAAACHALSARVRAGKEMPAYSVHAGDQSGLAQTARLLEQLGWKAVAVSQPIQHVPESAGLLVMVEPGSELTLFGPDMNDLDVRGLLRWIEQGNTLLLMGRHNTRVHQKLDVLITNVDEEEAGQEDAVPNRALGYATDVELLAVAGRDTIQAPGSVPLWWHGDRPGAVLVRRGQGRVLVVPDPSLFTRRGLRGRDNVIFLYNVALRHARNGRVYFDEYHHGFRSGGGFWGYLGFHQQQWIILPVLLTALVAGWSLAYRLGPPVAQPPVSHADAVDYASALARIHQLAGARSLPARSLARDFHASLVRMLRLHRTASAAEVLAAWKKRTGKHKGEDRKQETEVLSSLLRGFEELQTGNVTDRRLLNWTRAFDDFLKNQ